MKIHHQIVVLKYDSSKTIVELLAKFIQNKKKSTASRHRNRNIDCSPVAVVNKNYTDFGNGVVKWVINKKTTSYDKHNTMEYSTVEWTTINKAEHNVPELFQLCIVEAPPALPRRDRVVESTNYQTKVFCSYSRQIASYQKGIV
ncbi:hypothetical protein T05_4751 [Trichinella murrelli]|uniref:Uncharacterized protein n=1 Tax=Trichinella murrelli TaxID=144512 RepID=A0A0V0UFU9_9BILA|nr:hypothetical protein T05_4751 [Trichinella murrelli]